MRWLELKIPPPIVGLAVAALMWAAATAVPAAAFHLPGRSAIALSCAIAGACFDLAGLVAFRRARTTINPLRPDMTSTLVRSGIYRYTRNPMYVGMLLILTAWGVWLANLLSLGMIVLFVAYMNRFQIGPEERSLAARFGQEFAAYRRRSRRWL